MDNLLAIIPLLGAGAVTLLGGFGFVRPLAMAQAAGLAATAPHGISELRGLFGGLLGAVGLVCLITREPAAFLTAAAALFGAGLSKGVSLAIDRPAAGKVIPTIIMDFAFGAALLMGYVSAN